jgi:hypothetical protein
MGSTSSSACPVTPCSTAVDEIADDIRTRRALDQKPCLRGFAETSYREIMEDRSPRLRPDRGPHQGPRHPLRRHQHQTGSAEHIYETLYCARGQAENLIKLHKAQLASDRTRLAGLHVGAFWDPGDPALISLPGPAWPGAR